VVIASDREGRRDLSLMTLGDRAVGIVVAVVRAEVLWAGPVRGGGGGVVSAGQRPRVELRRRAGAGVHLWVEFVASSIMDHSWSWDGRLLLTRHLDDGHLG
jgi:hypothetical protein